MHKMHNTVSVRRCTPGAGEPRVETRTFDALARGIDERLASMRQCGLRSAHGRAKCAALGPHASSLWLDRARPNRERLTLARAGAAPTPGHIPGPPAVRPRLQPPRTGACADATSLVATAMLVPSPRHFHGKKALLRQCAQASQMYRSLWEQGMTYAEAVDEAERTFLVMPSRKETPILTKDLAPFGQPTIHQR